MDLKQAAQNILIQNTEQIRRFANPNPVALQSVRALAFQRIVNNGLNTNGNQIGKYSTKPTFVGRKSFRTKGAADRFFKSKPAWRRINGYNVALLPGGYKNIREREGNQTRFVDLFFSGTMMRDYAVEAVGAAVVFGFRNPVNGLKMRGNEKRFGADIISLGPDEIQLLIAAYYG